MSASRKSEPRIHRRRFLQIVALAGAAGAAYRFGLRPAPAKSWLARESRTMMGTQINLIVYGEDQQQAHRAVDRTLARMAEVEALLSRHQEESELSRLNRDKRLAQPSKDLQAVLTLAEEISERSSGAFDITVLPLVELYRRNPSPDAGQLARILESVDHGAVSCSSRQVVLGRENMALTLDGIAKGYVVDQGVQTLREQGCAQVYVEAGGDLMVAGGKPQDQPWRIGVRNPRPGQQQERITLELSGPTAVATSGDYIHWYSQDLRHHHIIDPRTGISPPELASATVTAPSVALADGLATAAMVLGPQEAVALLESMEHCEGLLIDKGLEQHRSSGFQG
ncbi:FAD:protein FMN transferase [Desulfogranum mediterraneum]|uniref:FAD:protein FMN transferase n=1 Tax=Desulfogranum mediterraneum TaxID=160661 RepID=UPI000418D9B4|nr:FAD:protein FMN transferase [Desulfogranum mediterraneum]